MPKFKTQVVCSNCGFRGELMYERGTKIIEQDCPNCGVKGTLVNEEMLEMFLRKQGIDMRARLGG